MTQKLDTYDIIAVMIPGILAWCWFSVCFPGISKGFVASHFPEIAKVIVFVAVVFFIGQLIQTLGSIFQGFFYFTWKGRPSDKALEKGLGSFLPTDSAERIREKLIKIVGPKSSTHSLFLYAKQIADENQNIKIYRFNYLYAYHRSLIVLVAICIIIYWLSLYIGSAATWYPGHKISVMIALGILLIAIWYRTKQRSFHYVKEVLLVAENILDKNTCGMQSR